jgi:hypothetical protein
MKFYRATEILSNDCSMNGFRITGRMKWNDAHKPPGWNYGLYKNFNGGRPDVVFMVYDPVGSKKVYRPGEAAGDYFDDWDAAAAAQDAAVSKINKDINTRAGAELDTISMAPGGDAARPGTLTQLASYS